MEEMIVNVREFVNIVVGGALDKVNLQVRNDWEVDDVCSKILDDDLIIVVDGKAFKVTVEEIEEEYEHDYAHCNSCDKVIDLDVEEFTVVDDQTYCKDCGEGEDTHIHCNRCNCEMEPEEALEWGVDVYCYNCHQEICNESGEGA